jgi:L-ascorbate metabolism protein UlaG (beta-lactamase superfamily)
MTITKYGHACLLVGVNGVKILVDPGNWNPVPQDTGIHALLVTHEHQDHMDIAQIKEVMARNPVMHVITHAEAGAKLAAEGIEYEPIEPGQIIDVDGVPIESIGTEHAAIYGTSPCRNTGFLINNELFVTGDAVHDVPNKPVRVLALPTGGPWMKIAEAIDYAKAVKPAIAFPVHDAMYIESYQRGLTPRLAEAHLASEGIRFIDMPAGATLEF